MMENSYLYPISLREENNKLYLGKYSLEYLAKTFGTPLYVYDEFHLKHKMSIYENNFKSPSFNAKFVYASKAFLTPYIANVMKNANWHMDATSLGDIYIMINSGFHPSQIVFHGNNKSYAELEFAIQKEIGIIVVDNIGELDTIIEISNKFHKEVKTMFRMNPGIEAHTHYYIQTSLLSSKFGESIYDVDTIAKIIDKYKTHKMVKLLGFHSHIGSQITDQEGFLKNVHTMAEFTKMINEKYHMGLTDLNLGGGFGITYTDEVINLPKVLQAIACEIEHNYAFLKNVYLEPGRSIVGDAGITLYEIDYLKTTYGGKKYLFIDGGMTDNIRPALYDAKYTVLNASCVNDEEKILVDVVGKCCESGDIIRKDVMISNPKKYDILAVFATGAYCYSMSFNYNNLLRPACIVCGDDIKLISRRQELNDLLKF